VGCCGSGCCKIPINKSRGDEVEEISSGEIEEK
jgi:hypothetical protein